MRAALANKHPNNRLNSSRKRTNNRIGRKIQRNIQASRYIPYWRDPEDDIGD